MSGAQPPADERPRALTSERSYQLRITPEVERPAALTADALAQALPALAVAIQVPVLEHDARSLGALGDKAHLDLARPLEIRLDLPLRTDVPAKHKPVRGLVGEHARPLALAAVHAAVVDPAARARLEDRLRDLHLEHVVLARLDAVKVLGENAEGALDRRLDD